MTDETANNFSISDQTSFSQLGEVFAVARNAKNLTLKDASNHLRLSVKQIEALESNDFASLPQAMITRGFIRNYARLLEVDPEPLLLSYSKRMPEITPPALSVVTSMIPASNAKKSSTSFKYVLASLLLGLALLAWFFYQNNFTKLMPAKSTVEQVNSAVTTNATTTPNVNPLPEIALPAAERQPERDSLPTVEAIPSAISDTEINQQTGGTSQQVSAEAKEVIKNQTATTESNITPSEALSQSSADEDFQTLKEKVAQKAKVAQAAIVVTPQTALVGASSDDSARGSQKVDLTVSEKTWVRVRDKSGSVVFEKLLEPNSTAGFDGLPPLNVWIGNAKATTLTYSGKAVDLTANTKNNIARIKLE